jgi:GNAT superfamily N-acetyltransferase
VRENVLPPPLLRPVKTAEFGDGTESAGREGEGVSVFVGEEPIRALDQHGEVPIAFLVERVLEVSVSGGGLGGLLLSEVPVDVPWVKDYDAVKGEGPARWAKHFDVTNWGLIAAHDGEHRVGGGVVAFNTAGVSMLEGRDAEAVLWDIRVRPEARSVGTGTLLFRAAETWARDRGCRTLKVETQNINVPACRFYRRMGCTLGSINRFAYADLPDEVQLMWLKEL